MSNKYLLYDRFNRLDSSFRYPMIKEDDGKHYLRKLNEGADRGVFSKLAELFIKHNKLSGNVNEDNHFLNEFTSLMEEEDFDPFSHLKDREKIDEKVDCVLTFSSGNKKLSHPYFSLPAGYTCPLADICKTMTPRDRKKIDNKLVQDYGDIRCYASSEEARYPNSQSARWKNKDLLDMFDLSGKVDLILKSIKYYEQNNGKMSLLRLHESGDFYDQKYFDAWLEVTKQRPDILFYAYTKSLPFWIARMSSIPTNFKLVASSGGLRDDLIKKHNLRYVVIVQSPEEAANLRLPIDVDDSLAYAGDGNFALLIHGTQKAGSDAMKNSLKNREIIKKYKE